MTRWISNLLRSRKTPEVGSINFIHHQPKIYNIGDDLCSPRHYFSLQSAAIPLTILGGGAYNKYAVKYAKRYGLNLSNTVLWGVGESTRKTRPVQKIETLPFAAWGIRDRLRADAEHYLPCASCLHPMLDTAPGSHGTLLFLNADPNVTDTDAYDDVAHFTKQKGWSLLYNSCSASELTAQFSSVSHVITNSYHGAYWALLTGHTVTLMGYSSKFTSLLSSLGLDSQALIAIQRGIGKGLLTTLEKVEGSDRQQLPDAKQTLDAHRALNLRFAQKLKAAGLISHFERIHPVNHRVMQKETLI